MKDDKYALFECIFTWKVWLELAQGHKWILIMASFRDLIYLVLSYYSEEGSVFAVCIWYARIRLRHEGKCACENSTALQALNTTREFLNLRQPSIATFPSLVPSPLSLSNLHLRRES